LSSSLEIGFCKCDVLLKKKSRKEYNRELDNKCSYMRAYGNYAEVQHSFLQNEIVNDKIQNPVKNKICNTSNPIPEKLERH
jgi:hypothetical protein